MGERMPPVPGVNQIAYRILQKVKEIETPEYKECKAKSAHLPHVWARGRVEDRYWCPGSEAPIPTEDLVWDTTEVRALIDEPVAPRRTKEGWLEAPGPSRYFRPRPRR